MTGDQIETDPSARPDSEGPIYLDAADLLAPHASVWILIAAFVGLAAAWRTGAMPAWEGGAIAGGAAFLVSAALIATAIRRPDILPGYFRFAAADPSEPAYFQNVGRVINSGPDIITVTTAADPSESPSLTAEDHGPDA